MPHYHYQGRSATGEKREGVMEAVNEQLVAAHLLKLEITPVEIVKHNKSSLDKDLKEILPFFRPKLDELGMLAKQISSLLKAGVPISQALKVVADTNGNVLLVNALTNILIDLESGYSLARCFQKQKNVFPDFFIAMIDVGEQTGRLDESFHHMFYYADLESLTQKRIKSALRYPLLVLSAILIALFVIHFLVVPSFKQFFMSLDAALPLPTLILITVSDFLIRDWPYLLVGFGAALFFGVKSLRDPRVRVRWDQFKLKLPWVGSIMHRTLMARFARALAMAQQSGLPTREAIALVAKTTDNSFMTKKIMAMRKGLEHGESFSMTAKNSKIFSPLVLQMLQIGEETGHLDQNLVEIASFYEQDVDNDIKKLHHIMEPMLIAVIAGLVLILALGVFLPLWDLSGLAMQKVHGG